MQLFVLAIMITLLTHDAYRPRPEPALEGGSMIAAAVGPYLLLVIFLALTARWALRRLATHPQGISRTLRRLDLAFTLTRMLILALVLADLFALGYLTWLRQQLGDWVLVNDLLAIAPALLTVLAGWWLYYPVERRVREALVLRQLDEGEPLWPMPTRGQYVLSQTRHQLLLMLVPLTILLGWVQIVDRYIAEQFAAAAWVPSLLTFAGGLGVFLTAPLMIRYVWDTVALPEGPLRQRLLDLCDRYGVRIRQLLLWRTHGGMINGAVMGLLGRLRYILLTDGLIERMDDRHVEAVMAHELGHIVRHHMPWMALTAVASIAAIALGVEAVIGAVTQLIDPDLLTRSGTATTGIQTAGTIVMIGLWALAFGWISRRFERQADVFAVQHMARKQAEAAGETDPRAAPITPEAVHTVSEALRQVATLNNQPLARRSWRHGSIAWRIEHLQSLTGRRIDRCRIDRTVRLIRFAALGLIAAVVAIETLTAYPFSTM